MPRRAAGARREPGRNFAAGMTGGLAYVFDEQGDFALRWQWRDGRLGRWTRAMRPTVRALLLRHHELTGSPRAADLLARWENGARAFWRIIRRAGGCSGCRRCWSRHASRLA